MNSKMSNLILTKEGTKEGHRISFCPGAKRTRMMSLYFHVPLFSLYFFVGNLGRSINVCNINIDSYKQ